MDAMMFEAEKLAVPVEWYTQKVAPIGLPVCPRCYPEDWPERLRTGFLQPCHTHDSGVGDLAGTADERVTAPDVALGMV